MEDAVSDTDSHSWRPARGGPVSVLVPLGDLSRVGEARRAADTMARGCGLDETARGTLGLVVTEAATNLARHSRDGYILLRDTSPNGRTGVEMLAVDRGPGMQDLDRFFADGYSTGGTPGQGLGAMKRQADELDVYSVPGQGTVVLARVFSAASRKEEVPNAVLRVGAVCVPFDGETASGDGWCVEQEGDRAMVLLVDGLGHGPNAAAAADEAIASFRAAAARPPREVVAVMHEALRATRGAAVAVAEVRQTDDGARVTFCGVGNTVTAIVGATAPLALPSMNGTAGLQIGKPQEFTQPFAPGAMMVMHTDGITTRWRLGSYPGVSSHDPAIVAALLHRDHTRPRDDSTVLALALRPRRKT
jgi:anti-sigma regulatory factor (Ser/Thr protein kinase)